MLTLNKVMILLEIAMLNSYNNCKFHTLDSFVSNRNVYDDCDENGLTIYEYGQSKDADKYTKEACKKAIKEFETVMNEMGAIING